MIAVVLAAVLVYLVYQEVKGSPVLTGPRKRLCDYGAAGSVYEDIPSAMKRGIRALEVHVYSDEQDKPVVATRPMNSGYDFAPDNVSFESVCVDIVNDAFPSKDPLILSIVMHTDKSIVAERVVEHLRTTVRRRMISGPVSATTPIDALADKVVIVGARGSALDSVLNMSWSDSDVRRLTYQQALHPRDPEELMRFTKDNIALVAQDPELKTINANPNQPLAFGCQWNFYLQGPGGFFLVR
jgi:hypothetical protein